jgi:hypothetical protein
MSDRATDRQRYYKALQDGEHWTAALVKEALGRVEATNH